jgi:hypothetical protein
MLLDIFGADPRGLAAARALLALQAAYNLAFFWIWEMQGPDGLLSEELVPRHAFACESVYCATGSSTIKTAIALLHLAALLRLVVCGPSSTTCLFVYVMQCSLHNRNIAGTYGGDMLIDRAFLALALVDERPPQPQDRSRKGASSRRFCDGGVVLLYASFTTMWCLHGIEKLLEWEHWWARGDALLLSLYSDESFLYTRAFADWILRVLPYWVHVVLCRLVVLVEFPLGLALMVAPWESARLCGFGLIFLLLLSFSVFLNVEFFPWTCMYMALPFVPSFVFDALGSHDLLRRVSRRTSLFMPMASAINRHNCCAAGVAAPVIPVAKRMVGCATALIVVFHAVRSSLDHHPSMTLWDGRQHVVSPEWDKWLRRLGDEWHLCGGWKAFTPPPSRRHWYAPVGFPPARVATKEGGLGDGSAWYDRDGRGIAVSFYGGFNDTTDTKEGDPFDDVHWNPPYASMAQIPYWKVQARQAFLDWVVVHANPLAEVGRGQILARVCREFHERHPLRQQRIEGIEVWNIHREYKIQLDEDSLGITASFSMGPPTVSFDYPLIKGTCAFPEGEAKGD